MKDICYNKIIQKRYSNRFQNKHRRKVQCTNDEWNQKYNTEVKSNGRNSLRGRIKKLVWCALFICFS